MLSVNCENLFHYVIHVLSVGCTQPGPSVGSCAGLITAANCGLRHISQLLHIMLLEQWQGRCEGRCGVA